MCKRDFHLKICKLDFCKRFKLKLTQVLEGESSNDCYDIIYLRINYFYSLMFTAFTPHFPYNVSSLHCIVSSLKTRKQWRHLQYCKLFFATRIFNHCRNKAFIIDGCWGCNWRDFILMPCLAAPWLKFPTRQSLWTFHPCGNCKIRLFEILKNQSVNIGYCFVQPSGRSRGYAEKMMSKCWT